MLRGQAAVEAILSQFDLVLLDCDGVVYQGNLLLPGAAEAIAVFKNRNIETKFITNTSTRSVEKMHAKFQTLGLHSVSLQDCFHSGVAVAHFLSRQENIRTAYVIGESGLCMELERVGISCFGGPDDFGKKMTEDEFLRLSHHMECVDAVVVGYDMDFSFYKLTCASLCFQKNPNCLFVAANADLSDKIGTHFIPGNGAALAAVCAVVDKEPVIVGKPNKLFADLVLGNSVFSPERILVIGDRMDTDVLLAKNCGFKSCLVLSGCSSESDAYSSCPPDYLLTGLSEIAS